MDLEWEQLLKNSHPRNFSSCIVFDILTRLPVKSILRFKSVCQKWQALFGDSHFIKCHLKRSTERDDHCYLAREFNNVFYEEESRNFNGVVFSLRSEENFEKLRVLHFKPENFFYYCVVASLDGIVCITKYDFEDEYCLDMYVMLWNPATNELRILPKFPGQEYGVNTCIGFGFDRKNNDYKVVVHSCSKDILQVNVFSLKADCWRIVQVDSYKYLMANSIHVNGRMHNFGCNSSRNLILSFDFTEETLIEMDTPDIGMLKVQFGNFSELCKSPESLGESLILCEFTTAQVQWHWKIWYMKEYGDSNSWTRLSYFPSHPIRGRHIYPFIFLDNGTVIKQFSKFKKVLYNPKTRENTNIDYSTNGQVIKYKESLMSVKGSGSIDNLNYDASISDISMG